MTDKIKLPRDMKLGAGTFKAGTDLNIFLKAVDRHNKFFERLYARTPKEVLVRIVSELSEEGEL